MSAQLPRVLGRVAALLLAGVAIAATATATVAPEGASVTFRGERYAFDELPDEVSPKTRIAIEAWSTWALANDYRLDLDRSGICVFVSPDQASAPHQLELIDEAVFVFDKWLPSPPAEDRHALAQEFVRQRAEARQERLRSKDSKRKKAKKGEDRFKRKRRIPEDPDDLPFPWKGSRDTDADERYEDRFRWGAGEFRPDAEAVVFFALRGPEDQLKLLEELVRKQPYLEAWSGQAAEYAGFTLHKPVVGAYLLDAPDLEEWHPDAELVNRMARLLLLRRYGRQPFWLTQGFGWAVELTLRDAVYCFPYRAEFVGIGEHTDWDKDLARRLVRRDTLEWKEVAGWKRGTYDDHRARVSWGILDFAIRERGERLPLALEHLRQRWESDSRVEKKDGTWERKPLFELPAGIQGEILESYLGEDFLTATIEALKK